MIVSENRKAGITRNYEYHARQKVATTAACDFSNLTLVRDNQHPMVRYFFL